MVTGFALLGPLHCKLQTRPLAREDALHEERNCQIYVTQLKSDHVHQWGVRHQDELADWQSVVKST
jgi:hypothetical protein